MKKYLFITGVIKSGSTLLDMLIGSGNDLISLGEIHKLSHYISSGALCTCGEKCKDCPFWESIRKELAINLGSSAFSWSNFSLNVEQSKSNIHRNLPTFNELLLLLGNRNLWRAVGRYVRSVRRYVDVSSNTIKLFETVSKVTNKPIVCQSMKWPILLKYMYLTDPYRMNIIFIIRDGRAVSHSVMSMQNMNIEEASKYWVRFHRNLKLMMITIPKKKILRIYYEELCTNTFQVISKIWQHIGLVEPPNSFTLNKNSYHIIGGNPMRFRRNEINVVLNERWRNELSAKELAIFDAIGGKLNARLGYSRD